MTIAKPDIGRKTKGKKKWREKTWLSGETK